MINIFIYFLVPKTHTRFTVTVKEHLNQPYHSFSRALPLSTAAPLLIELSSLRHQAHTEQLVHHTCTGPLGRELLQDVTQHICENPFHH